MKRSVLVTGASGFIGSNVALHCFAQGYRVYGTYHTQPFQLKGIEARRLDVCQPSAILALLEEARPDFVFHLGAMADPDACAKESAACRQINVQGPKLLAQACALLGCKLLFVSTDLVFDGSKSYACESDEAKPLGAYGQSKLDAEAEVLKLEGARPCALRAALTYGWGQAHGRSFAENCLKRLLTAQPLRCFSDQYRTPVWVEDLCEVLLDTAEKDLRGLYHAGGSDRLSRYTFAQHLAAEFNLDERLLQSISMQNAALADPRPKDCSLDSGKLRTAVGFSPKGISEGLQAMHARLRLLR